MTRVTIAEFGAKRAKVRVFTEGDLVRVTFRVAGKLRTQSWPNTPAGRAESKAFAKGVADQRLHPITKAPLSLRELWRRYAEAEFPHLRDRSKKLYTEYFARWIAMWGGDFMVEDTTLAMVHEFRAALVKQKLKTSTIRQTIQTAKMVYRWGRVNKLVAVNEIADYRFKVAKEDRAESPAEYSADETAKILGALDRESATQWRAWVALQICVNQGTRQNAVLHLKWTDIDELPDSVTWRAEWDKMGKEWPQPIRPGTRAALEVARRWREKMGYEGPWILPAGSSKNGSEVYTIQSLWAALKGAEERSGVTKIARRGGHGFRRSLVGDITEATGDPALALQAVGDTDIRQANSYLKKRDPRVRGAFEKLDNQSKEK